MSARTFGALSVTAGLVVALTGCGAEEAGGGAAAGPIVIDGSSTVEPLSTEAARVFQEQYPDVRITVGTSGTGGGFRKFCAGETDVSDASRPINDEEKAACAARNIAFEELQIANDGLTVAVNKANTWATCLTLAQLKAIWEPGSQVKTWNQVDPSFPNEPLPLFGAGRDSGTFDYFTAAVNGQEDASRTDYAASENDNDTVQGIERGTGAMGYFGYSYFERNQDRLNAVAIDSGGGCVSPSPQTVQNGTYKPLGRPLFIYVSDASLKKRQVVLFADFYLVRNEEVVRDARFVEMTREQKLKAMDALDTLRQKAGP
jgi:phosphate transport system substrate-binding protein